MINVTDNGYGIPFDQLEQIKQYLQSIKSENNILDEQANRPGYALVNIIERLRINYDKTATIDIESKVEFGTKVKITIPI